MLAALVTVVAAAASVLLLKGVSVVLGEPALYADCMEDVAGSLRDSALFLDGALGGRGA